MATILFNSLVLSCWMTCIFSLLNSCLVYARKPLSPATLPLAVRSPYLSAWESSLTTGQAPLNQWPVTWPASPQVLGWFGAARVDGAAYRWLGNANPPNVSVTVANTTAVSVTPTRTIFTIPCGPMVLNVTFLSPIEPGDRVRQSIPFSYMYVDATSTDGKPHNVQIYSDISAEWTAPDRVDSSATWSTAVSSDNVYHAIVNSQPIILNETQQQAHWGTSYYAAQMVDGLTYQTGADAALRSQFIIHGNLTNHNDTDFRGIHAKPGSPVFGMAQDLGNIVASKDPVVWAVGFTRSPTNTAIRTIDLGGNTLDHILYYRTTFFNDADLIKNFLDDFANASQRADNLDEKVLTDARAVSLDYADIVSLAARQVYGAVEITLGANSSDCLAFMKNHGGPGDSETRRVNPVETLFASFPMFMYLDPTLGRPLLEPLLSFQDSAEYTRDFAAGDIGSGYPIAQASLNSSSQQGVEQTANMLIMMYAYARTTGDGSFAGQYYGLLRSYTDYLINNTLFTTNQTSADHRSFANQTNLAIKGIIAISAMSELSTALGQTVDAHMYKRKASKSISKWEALALSPSTGGLQAVYGRNNAASWSLGYNLFADRWLGLNLLNSSVYDAQTRMYANLGSAGIFKFGLPVDSTDLQVANSTWNLFAAAIATNTTVQNQMISMVRSRASLNTATAYGAFPITYGASSGQIISGVASPALGAVFAPLALNVKAVSIASGNSIASDEDASTRSRNNTGTIAGAVIGATAAVSAIIGGLYWYRRRRAQQDYDDFLRSLEKGRETQVNPFADPVAEQLRAEMSTTVFPPKKTRLGPHEDFDPDSSSIYSETGATTSGISSTSLSRTNSADSQAEEHHSHSQTAAALKALERLREMKANSRLSGSSITSGLPSTVRPRIIGVDSALSRSPSALKVLEHLQEMKTNPQSKPSSRGDIPESLRPKNSTYTSIARSGSTLKSVAGPSHRSLDSIRGSFSSSSANVSENTVVEASGSGSTPRQDVAKLLINEMKEIKREMEVMRAGAAPSAVEEPPPTYQG